jgi:hypothetical protein
MKGIPFNLYFYPIFTRVYVNLKLCSSESQRGLVTSQLKLGSGTGSMVTVSPNGLLHQSLMIGECGACVEYE